MTDRELLEAILETLDEIKEGQERLEEAVANVSLPGVNYSVDNLED